MVDADLGATLAAARRGERDALAVLWRSYQAPLLRYFAARGAPDPEDLASQVWVDVARRLDAVPDDDEGFRRWLFTVAFRRMADGRRRDARHPTEALDQSGGSEPRGGRTASEPRRALDLAGPAAEDEVDALDWALRLVRRLPSDQADAVLLRVLADLDVAAVAAMMQRSEGAVRVLTHRGLHRLAEMVASYGRGTAAAGGSPEVGIGAAAVTTGPAPTMSGSPWHTEPTTIR